MTPYLAIGVEEIAPVTGREGLSDLFGSYVLTALVAFSALWVLAYVRDHFGYDWLRVIGALGLWIAGIIGAVVLHNRWATASEGMMFEGFLDGSASVIYVVVIVAAFALGFRTSRTRF